MAYIGETVNFNQRMSQHKADIRLLRTTTSPLAEHAALKLHDFDFEKVDILARERSTVLRKNLESAHILSATSPLLNRNQGTLHSTYIRFLKK